LQFHLEFSKEREGKQFYTPLKIQVIRVHENMSLSHASKNNALNKRETLPIWADG
jgi:hypothetical protein